MTDGRLLVVSGPGGVGKGTVVAALRRLCDDLALSVSVTTRPPRPGEVDGQHYHFLDPAAFDAMIEGKAFLEWAEFGGHRYGTPWRSIAAPLSEGRTVVLEIEVQGALQVRSRFPEALLVFLEPPDPEALVCRLTQRGTDDPARIMERMRIAEWELAQARHFDHVVVNDDVAAAAQRIALILDSNTG